jgi:cell fate (sporulation/competence/biofilm development) regulator YlbF (YheA/YmcA/DUF963 family)
MSDVDHALEELIEAITSSDEYNKYQSALREVRREPELKSQIDAMRERNFELQQQDIDPGRLAFELDQFEREYEQFRANPKVHYFLARELAFIRQMQHIFDEIMESIEFD